MLNSSPGDLPVKNLPVNAGDAGLIPGLSCMDVRVGL